MADAIHPAATTHLPFFVTPPGASDWLMTAMAIFMLLAVLGVGIFYLKLHALPEQMAHRSQKVQMQLVAVLALTALFTHNHAFWIAALLISLVDLPDFGTPMSSMAASLEKMSGRTPADPAVPEEKA